MSNRISELEGAVLGLIWANPGTPYQIRQVLQRSPNPSWSGSAGAIYPLFERLGSRGFLAARRIKTGERQGKVYSITKEGMRALRGWMAPPFLRTTIGVPIDPLRTRARFLAVLPHEKRKRFLANAIAKLREHITTIRADCRKRKMTGDVFSYFTARGALLSCGARLQWMVEMRNEIAARPSVVGIRTGLPRPKIMPGNRFSSGVKPRRTTGAANRKTSTH
jgi:DNA-binding PadR family transcriptional regulator